VCADDFLCRRERRERDAPLRNERISRAACLLETRDDYEDAPWTPVFYFYRATARRRLEEPRRGASYLNTRNFPLNVVNVTERRSRECDISRWRQGAYARARMSNRKEYQAKIHAADGRAIFIARVCVISSREKEPAIFIFLARRGQGEGAS